MKSQYTRHGQSWSAEEDRKLYDLTVSGVSLSDICLNHQRSSGGIKSRQVRLGLRSEQSSELIAPPPPFQPYGGERSSAAPHDEVAIPRTKKPQASARPAIDPKALIEVIEDHLNIIERIWLAVERDIKEIYSKKAASTKDRNAHIVTSRLSPGNEYYEMVTLQDLGKIYGISRERVRQIEEKGLRLLKSRIRAVKSWTYGVLNEHQLRTEDNTLNQIYEALIKELIASEATDKFATFVLTAMGRIDGLTSSEIDKFESTFRQVRAEKQKLEKVEAASNEKIEHQLEAANAYVSAVLAKSSFSGTFAAEGVSLKEMPRLRSCKGGRELYSKTLGRFVQWESQGERRFIEALDRSSVVSEFAEQPFEIQFVYDGRVRKYYVDLLIRTDEDLTIAVEIKAPVMLADRFVLAKAKAAERIFGQYGIGYCLVDANGRSRQDISKVIPDERLKAFLRKTLQQKGNVGMRELRDFLGEWPSQEISNQIQSLVLKHNLDYRVELLPNRDTGQLGCAYTFTLSLPNKNENDVRSL
jgi:hypothetical protein